MHSCNTVDGDNNRRSNAACTVEDVFRRAHTTRLLVRTGGGEGWRKTGECEATHGGQRREVNARGRERERDAFSVGKKRPVRVDRRCKGARASPVSAHGYCRWRADATWRPERGVQRGGGSGGGSARGLSAGGGEVDRAACVTSEAPGGIGNHHNRVDAYVAEGDVGRQRSRLEDRGRGGHRG